MSVDRCQKCDKQVDTDFEEAYVGDECYCWTCRDKLVDELVEEKVEIERKISSLQIMNVD